MSVVHHSRTDVQHRVCSLFACFGVFGLTETVCCVVPLVHRSRYLFESTMTLTQDFEVHADPHVELLVLLMLELPPCLALLHRRSPLVYLDCCLTKTVLQL